MLGWHVFVYHQSKLKPEIESLVAKWDADVWGLKWLDALVKEKKAAGLYGNGYPSRYSAKARILLPIINAGLPADNSPPVSDDGHILPKNESGDIVWNQDAVLAFREDNLLFIDVWDRS